jgi:predicted nucleotide-binding protein
MLPVKGTPEDVKMIVDYLKTKATGVSLAEAKATIDPRHLDSRKMSSYATWGLIVHEEGILKLTNFGRRLGRASSGSRNELFGEIVRNVRAYRIAAEWIFHNGFEVITAVDLAAHWVGHIPEELETTSEKSIREQATAFFRIAEAAGLGTYIIGRRQHPTRLEVAREPLSQLIAQIGFEGPRPVSEEIVDTTSVLLQEEAEVAEAVEREVAEEPAVEEAVPEKLHVFIAHSENVEILEQVKTMLELADLEFEIAEEEETTAIPVPDKVLTAMKRSNAAVICVTADEEMMLEEGSYSINQNVLIEIGAAFVLYDKRVILVWDTRVPVPSNLQGLYRCEFEGNELSWSAGMKLMKAVNEFKKPEV